MVSFLLILFIDDVKLFIKSVVLKTHRFYRIRAERVEWFADRNPLKPDLSDLLDLGLFLPLEKKDNANYQVFVIRTGVHDTHKHDQNDILKVRSSNAIKCTNQISQSILIVAQNFL